MPAGILGSCAGVTPLEKGDSPSPERMLGTALADLVNQRLILQPYLPRRQCMFPPHGKGWGREVELGVGL